MTDINNWNKWQTEITSARLNGELKVNTSFEWKTGGVKLHSILHTVEPLKHFGWTGKGMGAFAIHNWTLSESEGKTTVIVDESMEGFLVKLLKSIFMKSLEKGMMVWLELLKNECEKS